jgi:hypothetical protein
MQSAPHLRQVDYAKRWSRIQCSHLAYTNTIRVNKGRQEITVTLCSLFCHSVRCKTVREPRGKWRFYGGISEDSSFLGRLAVPNGKSYRRVQGP